MTNPPLAALRQRLWQELDMLCRLGLGLAPIATSVCAVLRQLVGADAVALFWLDEQGLPAGFYHEDSPAEAQNLFLNEYHRLFAGQNEVNITALARRQGQVVGHMLAPDAAYFRSNTYNLLVRASGHHHTLDLRVEVNGRTRAVVALFRAPGLAFNDEDAALLERASISLQRAFIRPGSVQLGTRIDGGLGHVLLDAKSLHPLLADAHATRLLREANLPGLGLQGGTEGQLPPDLLTHLGLGPQQSAQISVPDGLLDAQMSRLLPVHSGTDGSGQWLLTLQLQRPLQIEVVRQVLALPLSPLQREIAALAGLGYARAECEGLTGVGSAALKKHLRTILEVTHSQDWEDLAQRLQRKIEAP
ncbi:GAF domain-containing protein [Ottowia thiooxydans]|uniref:GAF domain-containing protein n=1 Tax=Ottowia thiooxydans TaxID=219182 RepID=A0ABV2Q625_9BURK